MTDIFEILGHEDLTFRLGIHPDADILAGHFPDQPLVPAACLVECCVRLASLHAGRVLCLGEASAMKFLKPLTPQTPSLQVTFSLWEPATDGVRVAALFSSDEGVHARLSMRLRHASDVCVIIPTYNNARTVADVARRALRQVADVIVVNDGSTDDTTEMLAPLRDHLTLVSYQANRGKGVALREGFRQAQALGFRYAITLDADGQHYPEDIPALLAAHEAHPDALIVGSRGLRQENMPEKNTFANRFSNFWFTLQTWQSLPDTQTGFRLYPLDRLSGLRFLTSRYEAELELLVFSAWRGTQLLPVPIRVYYPPAGQRVTHFRPVRDFARISVLNTVLCLLMLVYGWPRIALQRLWRTCQGGRRASAVLLLTLLMALSCGPSRAQSQRLTPYLPDSVGGPAVIVCPGGSYSWLDLETEGHGVARWLRSHGIAAFVLRYRTQGWPSFAFGYRYLMRGHRHPDPIDDLQAALATVRDSTAAWNVDTTRIGVMGFSAGGHLALSAGIGLQGTRPAIRPAFVVAVYPVVTMCDADIVHRRSRRALLGEYGKWNGALRDSLSIERHIPADMPPVLLVNCVDDPIVDYRNSVRLDSTLTARGVAHRYLQYERGGHGFGADSVKAGAEANQWKDEFLRWLRLEVQ